MHQNPFGGLGESGQQTDRMTDAEGDFAFYYVGIPTDRCLKYFDNR